MPKTKSPDKKASFTISLSPQALAMIEQLSALGLYGTNRAEISRSLINARLEDLIAKGIIDRPSAK